MAELDDLVESRAPARPRYVAGKRPRVRIGYLSDRFPGTSNGFMLQEIQGLQSLGIEVNVLSLGLPEGRIDQTALALGRVGRPVSFFRGEPKAPSESDAVGLRARQAEWVASEIVAKGIEHLHAHSATGPAEVAIEAGRLTGVGFSFAANADGLCDAANLGLLRKKIEDARFVVTLSALSRGRLTRMYGAQVADKLHPIPLGIDPHAYPFCPPELHDANSVLAFGPLLAETGFTHLVEAMAILRDRGRSTHLTIVGRPGDAEPALRAHIDSCRLNDRIELRSEGQADLTTLMMTHAAMVLPWVADDCDRDLLAQTVLQGMATGIVVLATDSAATRGLIQDGVTGRVLNQPDYLQLAAALGALFDSPQLRAQMALQARSRIERRFTASRNVSRLARLFAEAVKDEQIAVKEDNSAAD